MIKLSLNSDIQIKIGDEERENYQSKDFKKQDDIFFINFSHSKLDSDLKIKLSLVNSTGFEPIFFAFNCLQFFVSANPPNIRKLCSVRNSYLS